MLCDITFFLFVQYDKISLLQHFWLLLYMFIKMLVAV